MANVNIGVIKSIDSKDMLESLFTVYFSNKYQKEKSNFIKKLSNQYSFSYFKEYALKSLENNNTGFHALIENKTEKEEVDINAFYYENFYFIKAIIDEAFVTSENYKEFFKKIESIKNIINKKFDNYVNNEKNVKAGTWI